MDDADEDRGAIRALLASDRPIQAIREWLTWVDTPASDVRRSVAIIVSGWWKDGASTADTLNRLRALADDEL